MVLEDHGQVRAADAGALRICWAGGKAVGQADQQAALDIDAFTFVDTGRPHRTAAERLDLAVVMLPAGVAAAS